MKWNTVKSGQSRSTGRDLRKAAIRQIGVQSAGNTKKKKNDLARIPRDLQRDLSEDGGVHNSNM